MGKRVPKRIEKLLERRMTLSNQLKTVCYEIDSYCEKIGISLIDPEAVLGTDIQFFISEDGGKSSTLAAIKKL